MRKNYLDNLRTIMILFLFPYHTFMIWNNFGESFYIWDRNNNILSTLLTLMSPWLIPLLFVIAGISAKYSLESRGIKNFIKERVKRILIPYIIGILLLVPFQTLIARKFHFGYNGSIFNHYQYFFTHFTDLNGYDGCFTPAHLWFLLFLFVISIFSLIIIKYISYQKVSSKVEKWNILMIVSLFLPIFLFNGIGNFSGKSLGKFLILYGIGYYVLSNDKIINKVLKYKRVILTLFLFFQILLSILYYQYSYYEDFLVNFVGWLGILSGIIISKEYLYQKTKFTEYFSNASFSIYMLHQTILVVLGYYTFMIFHNIFVQIIIILLGSFFITLLCYEILRRIPYLRDLFGIKRSIKHSVKCCE